MEINEHNIIGIGALIMVILLVGGLILETQLDDEKRRIYSYPIYPSAYRISVESVTFTPYIIENLSMED